VRSWTGSPDRGSIDFKAKGRRHSRVKRVEIGCTHTRAARLRPALRERGSACENNLYRKPRLSRFFLL
jgi:hypothetical protein